MVNEESTQPSDTVTLESSEKPTDVDEVVGEMDESEVDGQPSALITTTSSTVGRKTPASIKLELGQKQEDFDDNHLVVTLTFAPNKVNGTDKHIMLAMQIAGDVVALKSFKQSTFGSLPEPIQKLLAQGRNEWPKRYADAVNATLAAQAKSATSTASVKAKGAGKTKVKPKDIQAPPPPAPLFGSVPSEIKVPDAHAALPQVSAPKSSNATLFDFGD